jgi:uncharacterized membrane protein (DUF485 family)
MFKRNDGSGSAFGDLTAIGIVAVVYFAYMLASVDLRPIFARPVGPGTFVPWGLVGGTAVVILVMIMAGLYMIRKNRAADRDGDA